LLGWNIVLRGNPVQRIERNNPAKTFTKPVAAATGWCPATAANSGFAGGMAALGLLLH
jgi:hypothetical protein